MGSPFLENRGSMATLQGCFSWDFLHWLEVCKDEHWVPFIFASLWFLDGLGWWNELHTKHEISGIEFTLVYELKNCNIEPVFQNDISH